MPSLSCAPARSHALALSRTGRVASGHRQWPRAAGWPVSWPTGRCPPLDERGVPVAARRWPRALAHRFAGADASAFILVHISNNPKIIRSLESNTFNRESGSSRVIVTITLNLATARVCACTPLSAQPQRAAAAAWPAGTGRRIPRTLGTRAPMRLCAPPLASARPHRHAPSHTLSIYPSHTYLSTHPPLQNQLSPPLSALIAGGAVELRIRT